MYAERDVVASTCSSWEMNRIEQEQKTAQKAAREHGGKMQFVGGYLFESEQTALGRSFAKMK